MAYLILGLFIFLGVHSVRLVSEDCAPARWRGWAKARTRAFTPFCRYWVLR